MCGGQRHGGEKHSHFSRKLIELLQEQIDRHEQEHNEQRIINLRIAMAFVYSGQQEYELCFQELKQCNEVCREKEYHILGALARQKMVLTLFMLGNSEAALSISKEALAEFEAIGDVGSVAPSLVVIADAQHELHQLDEALSSCELVLNLAQDFHLVNKATCLMGVIYSEKALLCKEHSDNDGANAMLHMSKKWFTEARNQAIKTNDEFFILKVDMDIASTQCEELIDETEKYDTVVQFFENLIDRAEKLKFPMLLDNIYIYSLCKLFI